MPTVSLFVDMATAVEAMHQHVPINAQASKRPPVRGKNSSSSAPLYSRMPMQLPLITPPMVGSEPLVLFSASRRVLAALANFFCLCSLNLGAGRVAGSFIYLARISISPGVSL